MVIDRDEFSRREKTPLSTSSPRSTLTALAFEGFNEKFWGRRLEEMPAVWGKLRRLERIAEVGDFRLPSQAPHFYPTGGFNPLFEKMLNGFDVRYGVQVHHVEIEGERPQVVTNDLRMSADLVIVTAPIDVVFGFCYGPLEWRGYRVEVETVRNADRAGLGVAPDGVPFSWVYTPWAVIPLGRLGLYKYVTMDSTYSMVLRLLGSLDRYLSADAEERFEILRHVRGDWSE